MKAIKILLTLFIISSFCILGAGSDDTEYSSGAVNSNNTESGSRETCPECDGSGYVNVECENCHGVGKSSYTYTKTDPTVCRLCYGKGKFYCTYCNGNGYIKCYVSNCYNGVRLCSCGGDGITALGDHCAICKGMGVFECTVCWGRGYTSCDKCNRRGKEVEEEQIERFSLNSYTG